MGDPLQNLEPTMNIKFPLKDDPIKTIRRIRWAAAYAWLKADGSTYDTEMAKNTAMHVCEDYLMLINIANTMLSDPIEPYEITSAIWHKKPIVKNLEKIIENYNDGVIQFEELKNYTHDPS